MKLKTGRYEVRISSSPNPNRATNVPVTITHSQGKDVVEVNQRKPRNLDHAFASVGTFTLESDTPASVTISNADTDEHVIVDAVQFVPVK